MNEEQVLMDSRLDGIFRAACVTRGLCAEALLLEWVGELLEQPGPELAELLAEADDVEPCICPDCRADLAAAGAPGESAS